MKKGTKVNVRVKVSGLSLNRWTGPSRVNHFTAEQATECRTGAEDFSARAASTLLDFGQASLAARFSSSDARNSSVVWNG